MSAPELVRSYRDQDAVASDCMAIMLAALIQFRTPVHGWERMYRPRNRRRCGRPAHGHQGRHPGCAPPRKIGDDHSEGEGADEPEQAEHA